MKQEGKTGRQKPVPTGEFFVEDCDTVVMALGCSVNPIIPSTDAEIRTNKWGVIQVDNNTSETSKKGVFAAGDAITGGSTVIQAMGQAKKAAAAIHEFVMGKANQVTQKDPVNDVSPGT